VPELVVALRGRRRRHGRGLLRRGRAMELLHRSGGHMGSPETDGIPSPRDEEEEAGGSCAPRGLRACASVSMGAGREVRKSRGGVYPELQLLVGFGDSGGPN
jgi:hypothetical protein